jgi:hypothetical protein
LRAQAGSVHSAEILSVLARREPAKCEPRPTVSDWASNAAIGIWRSMAAIHQHAERHGSFAAAARSLWTAAIPSSEPTLTDTHLYALLAIAEARTSAQGYCDLATGIEEELARNAIGHDEANEIAWLRGEIAQWEREQWRWSDAMRESAQRFLLLAQFASSTTAAQSDALRQAHASTADLRSPDSPKVRKNSDSGDTRPSMTTLAQGCAT